MRRGRRRDGEGAFCIRGCVDDGAERRRRLPENSKETSGRIRRRPGGRRGGDVPQGCRRDARRRECGRRGVSALG